MIFNNSKFNNHWNTKSLNQLGSFRRGKSKHRPRNDKKLFIDGLYPLIQTGDVKKANILIENHSNLYNDFGLAQSKLWPKGTLCITIAANIAETSLLGYPMCFPDSIVGFIADKKECSELYMHYIFTYIRSSIQTRVSGSIQDNINVEYLTSLKFKIPEKHERERIESILCRLDSKIELNNKINQELEAIAKTLYEYWFVQFDFPDKNGKPYKSSGGEMVFNEQLKREIPEGWEMKGLGEFAEIMRGQLITAKTADKNGKIKVVSAGIDYSYKHSLANRKKNTITISGSGANAGFINFWREPIFACDCTTIRGNTDAETLMIFGFLKLRQDYILSQARGSAQPHVYPKDISILKIALPNNELIKDYGNIVINGNDKIGNNIIENQKLIKLRDWLLPMLMNGQVTVKQAEEQLAMVAEDGLVYEKDKESIDALFATINYDCEVATILLLTDNKFGFTYGKKFIHKMFSNIQFLNNLPVFENLVFQEKGWGMFSNIIDATINNQKFIRLETIDNGTSVLKVKPNSVKEIITWTNQEENKEFVDQVNNMLTIYENPMILKDMDRIELLNTVLECMYILQTDNFQSIRNKMASWVMYDGNNKTKADKFESNETLCMIDFIKSIN